MQDDRKDYTTQRQRRKLAHTRSDGSLLYFTRWLRLRSLGGLEKARSTSPITRHNATTPNTTDIARKPPVFMDGGASARAEASGASKQTTATRSAPAHVMSDFIISPLSFSEVLYSQVLKTVASSARKTFAADRHC
jgi:hypothetical protein